LTAQAILAELAPLGRESYKKVIMKHGIPEPLFGVKIEELKKIQKRIKQDYQLALDLYDTGNYDAMYLAGLIADDARMTKRDLQHWLDLACEPLASHTLPSVAAGSPHGWALGIKWIDSKKPREALAGWATLSSIISVTNDAKLDLDEIKNLIERVQKTIHAAPEEARYAMNNFVICVGCYVPALTPLAKKAAEKIGRVEVDMGDTACQVPFAPDYIRKVEARGTIGKKRKSAKC
jgi:3-methyladenine DNA glycosylase AlkD